MRTPALPLVLAGLVVAIGLAAGCTRSLKEERHTAADARVNLLIAGDASAFKDRLRTRLIDHYRPYSNIDVVNVATLKQVDTDAYHAVVIIDTCLAWSRFNPSTKAFLDRIDERHKVVLLMTVDDTDWTFEYQGVDAMTAASVLEDEDRVFERLRQAIDRILEKAAVNAARPVPASQHA
jgi:hypothetical protein